MPIAARAAHFGAPHAVRTILDLGERVVADGLGERGPARARLELVPGAEQRKLAARAHIDARRLRAHEATDVRPLGAVLSEHLVLLPRQPLAPLFVTQNQLIHHGWSLRQPARFG